jgi:hypothetical protein
MARIRPISLVRSTTGRARVFTTPSTVMRSVMRFVPHTIRHVPEGGITFEAFCVTSGCGREAGPHPGRSSPRPY